MHKNLSIVAQVGSGKCKAGIAGEDGIDSDKRKSIKKISISTSSTAQGGGGSFKDRKPIGEVACCDASMAEQIH